MRRKKFAFRLERKNDFLGNYWLTVPYCHGIPKWEAELIRTLMPKVKGIEYRITKYRVFNPKL